MTTEPVPEIRTDAAGRPWEPWMYEQHEWVKETRAMIDARFQEIRAERLRSGRKTSERI